MINAAIIISDKQRFLPSFQRRPIGVKLRYYLIPASWEESSLLQVILRERPAVA